MIPKFRAWDRYEEAMARQNDIYFGPMDHDDTLGSLLACLPERYELMQSTGLKDKNGVEIFEGDIVAIKYSESGYHYYEKIVFENGTFTAGDEDWLYNIKDYCVVCGNIYDNPELLEGDKA